MWSSLPPERNPKAIDDVTEMLDSVLTPLGFAPGQGAASDGHGQVIFCRGETVTSDRGCVDLVVDLAIDVSGEGVVDGAVGSDTGRRWRVTDVRYWGFPAETWQLDFDREAQLEEQLVGLARTLPATLADDS